MACIQLQERQTRQNDLVNISDAQSRALGDNGESDRCEVLCDGKRSRYNSPVKLKSGGNHLSGSCVLMG